MTKKNKAETTESTTYDISIKDVIESNLVSNAEPTNLRYIGKNWFRHSITGVAYHFIRDNSGNITIAETRQSIVDKKKLQPKKKPPLPPIKLVTIKCIDCGTDRVIHSQDAFQVKRCVACQKKYRTARRAELIRKSKEEARIRQEQETATI